MWERRRKILANNNTEYETCKLLRINGNYRSRRKEKIINIPVHTGGDGGSSIRGRRPGPIFEKKKKQKN